MKNFIVGTINTTTNKYENIINVTKNNSYKCIKCNSDLILRKGEKNFQSFVHKNKNNCNYFKTPSMDELKNDAKLHLRELLIENNFILYRRCNCCKFNIKMDLPVISSNHSIEFSETDNFINVYNENKKLIYTFKMLLVCDSLEKFDETLDEKIYQINIIQLVHTIRRNFATQKVELICIREIDYCNNCLKYKE